MSDLGHLFTDINISADEATAIVAALRDIARVDGTHADEVALIEGFARELDADMGEQEGRELEAMTPKLLAQCVVAPELRTVAIQCGVLIAMADGAISDLERAKICEYAHALAISEGEYETLEGSILAWIKSGDMEPVMDSIYA